MDEKNIEEKKITEASWMKVKTESKIQIPDEINNSAPAPRLNPI